MSSHTDRPAQILRLADVRRRVGLSRSTIYARIAAGTFPGTVRIGENSVGWLDADIDDWIAARVAASRVTPRQQTATEASTPPTTWRQRLKAERKGAV